MAAVGMARRKVVKEAGKAVEEFEDSVAQALFDLEATNNGAQHAAAASPQCAPRAVSRTLALAVAPLSPCKFRRACLAQRCFGARFAPSVAS